MNQIYYWKKTMQKLEGTMGVRARDKIGDWFDSVDNQNIKIQILP